jgi:hypothetical protein
MCPLLVPYLPSHFWLFYFFWLPPITVLKRQKGRRYVPLISLSYLDVYDLNTLLSFLITLCSVIIIIDVSIISNHYARERTTKLSEGKHYKTFFSSSFMAA